MSVRILKWKEVGRVKRAIAILLAVFFVVAIASLSFAAEEKKAAPAPAATEKPGAPVKAEEKATPVKVKMVTGEVTAVDAKAKTITVKGKKGDVVVSVDDKMMAAVKVGDKAVVKYVESEGKNVAKSVKKAEVKAGEAKEKKAEPAAPAEKPAAPAEKPAKPAEKKY